MTIMTSREFNQHLGQAQKAAMLAPVTITNRGEPAFVLMSYAKFEQLQHRPTSAAQALTPSNSAVADIDFELPTRSKAQRQPVEL